ncbi:RAQPRD family integrative conjugative element protein, partial [uncultured Paraglaciecola sp.]|uniref:RAQPRD family integrative conjugative element protein n=1 Tax=uncultured Paraglaciecola sp. TaxID=1765024 RepID=UPI00345B7A85
AQQAANPDDRRQVNYQRLRADMLKIQEGILDAANTVRREPRSLPPIEGDYR